MRVFQSIKLPTDKKDNVVNKSATWNTWSSEARVFLKAWNMLCNELEDPKILSLLGGKPYDCTFSFDLSKITKELRHDLELFAESIYNLHISKCIMFFSNLLDEDFDGRGLHLLFACLRDSLVKLTGDPMSALYAPLGTTTNSVIRSAGADFLLHADLYTPNILFNVFEDVTPNSSGASLFLQTSSLCDILVGIKTLSSVNINRILNCLTATDREDRYTEFFNLLHSREHEWVNELEDELHTRQMHIKLEKGEGYLIHDRLWLHGREAPSTRVTQKRLHRLIFNTKDIQKDITDITDTS